MSKVEAGFAKTDISPELPIVTLYTRTKDMLADRIATKIYARATVLKNSDTKTAVISADLLALESDFVNKVKKSLAKYGFRPEHVMIGCSHTHSTPLTIEFNGYECMKVDKKYMRELEKLMVKCVAEAEKDLKPASFAWAKTPVNVNVNRREIGRMSEINSLDAPTGKVNNNLSMLFIEQEGEKKPSVIMNYAAHPLSVSGRKNSNSISADYPGELTRILEKDFRHAQFTQGAAGNLNVKISGGVSASRKVGQIMAEKVRKSLNGIKKFSSTSVLKMKTENVKIPVDNLAKLVDMTKKSKTPAACDKTWLRKSSKKDKKARSMPFDIQGLRIGNIYIAAIPGEQFYETAADIQKLSGKKNCFVAAYSNESEIGYVPRKEAFPEGDYEVDTAYKYYGNFIYRTSPRAPETFAKKTAELLKKLS